MNERVAVVGGGAVGVTAARDLAERGAAVTLYEREDVASGASGRAAGIVYDAVAEDVDVAVADRAVERFRTLDAEGAVEFSPRPYVWFARDGDERRARAVRESVRRMRANDRAVALLEPDAFADRFPALDGVAVAVGAVAENAGYVDPGSYVRATAERARDAGATIRTGTAAAVDVDGPAIEATGRRESYDAVLVAAGAHTKRLLADAGVAVPMKPYRVQALTTTALDGPDVGRIPMTYDATRGYYFRPRGGGLLAGDGTVPREFDPDDHDGDADPAFVDAMRDRIADALGVSVAVDRAWAGLCTATPDRDPLLGPVADGLFVAAGWHGSGFMRAPATGERIAEQILGGRGVDPFDPRRFDGDETFDVVEGTTIED